MLENKISWEALKIFAKECSNDDLRLTLSFFLWQGQIFHSFSSWILQKFLVQKLIKLVQLTGEHKNSFVPLTF